MSAWSQLRQVRVFFTDFEGVGRGSETQLQMGENCNKIP